MEDITINCRYIAIFGYTHHDLQTTFKEHLHNQGVDIERVKDWYNYLGDKIYNPFDSWHSSFSS